MGDVDLEVTLRGTWKWIKERKDFKVTKPWSPWVDPNEGQLIGYIKEYGNFTLATSHGKGHGTIIQDGKYIQGLVERYVKGQALI